MSWTRPIAVLLSFQIFSFPAQAQTPRVSLSFGLPWGGYLDRFHHPPTQRDPVANSLYALRNIAVEDLLNSRKALKILIGGESRLATLPHSNGLTFTTPSSVTRLYLTGLGITPRMPRARSGRGKNLGDQWEERSTPSPDSDTELGESIRWLDTSNPPYQPALRERLATGLAHASALLTKYDERIRFIETDWWNHGTIHARFYEESGLREMDQLAAYTADPTTPYDSQAQYDRLKARFMESHGMNSELRSLRAQREFLLNRYHLLALELDGRPLYKHLYQLMQGIGFPRTGIAQDPVELALPRGQDPIPVPTEFEDAVSTMLDRLASATGTADLRRLGRSANPLIDRSLVEALRLNTERLTDLCEVVDYHIGPSTALLGLAAYPELWTAARARYSYLASAIGFEAGQARMREYMHSSARARQAVTYAGYGAAIGVGVALIAVSGGLAAPGATAGTLFGLSVAEWLTGSALLSAGLAYDQYSHARASGRQARGTFFGGSRYGSAEQTRQATLIESESYQQLILTLVLAGVELHQIQLLTRAAMLTERAGRTFAAVPRAQTNRLRRAIQAVSAPVRRLVPAGVALLRSLERTLGTVTGTPTLVTMEGALPTIAANLRITAAQARERLLSVPSLGNLLRTHGRQILAPTNIWVKVVRESSVAGTMNLIAQAETRGDRFTEELGNVALTFATSTLTTAAIAYFGNSVNIRGRPPTEVARNLHGVASRNFWFGLGVNGAASGAAELIDEIRNPDRATQSERVQTVLNRALFGGIFMATSSTARTAVSRRLEESLSARLSQPSVQLIMLPISAANNGFGSWHFVRIAQATGVERPASPSDSFSSSEAVADLGGAYMRLDWNDSGESYMFDFLNEQEGDSP